MAAADTAPATQAPAFWNADPDALPQEGGAPAAAPAPKASPAKTAAPAQPGVPAFWNADPDKIEEPKPPQAPAEKPHEYAFLKGFVGQSNRLLTLLERTAGQSAEGLSSGEGVMSPEDAAAAHDEFNKRFVEPTVANQAQFELPPNATLSDKIFHGLGSTVGMIADAIATGGPAGEATTVGLGGGFGARAAGGAVTMTAPAAANAVEVGKQVYKETGDKHAAMTAGAVSYLISAASGAIPMGVGGNLLTRTATAGAAGVGLQEAGRVAQNAAMPENMQQEWNPEDDLTALITTAPFGLLPHAGGSHPVREQRSTIMDEAQQVAASDAAAKGADALGQVVAATQAEAHVGGLHDAVDTEASHLEETGHLLGALETRRAQAAQQMADEQALIDQGQREQEVEAAHKQKAAAEEAQKEKDFAAAKNQAGEQEVEKAKQLEIGAEKGGANEPAPALAEALPPETRGALEELRAKLAAQKAEEKPEPTVQERMREQAKGTDEDFKELPPEVPKKGSAVPKAGTPAPGEPLFPDAPVSPHMAAPEAPRKAKTPIADEELPEDHPPAPTPQTLVERRQAAFDAALRAKLAGQAEPAAPAEEAPAPATPKKPIAAPAAAPEAAKAPVVDRMAMIAAAAKKARAGRAAPPPAEEVPPNRSEATIPETEPNVGSPAEVPTPEKAPQYQAVNRDTGEKVADLADFEAAKAHRERFPNDDILPAEPGARFKMADEQPKLRTDNPGGEWLAKERALSARAGTNRHGAPSRFGSTTGSFDQPIRVPTEKLAAVPGTSGEQSNVRQDDLAALKKLMAGGKLPPSILPGRPEHVPFVMVDGNGKPWMQEGNHRVMAANALGWSHVPVEVKYFNGGEEVPGPFHPNTLLKDHAALANTPRLPETPRFSNAKGELPPVEHDTQGDGKGIGAKHSVTSENGFTNARVGPDGHIHVEETETTPGLRGRGEATARMAKLADVAHSVPGRKLVSDPQVSAPEQGVYARLKSMGYDVKENPSTTDPGTGIKQSASELKGVYEVGPKSTPRFNAATEPFDQNALAADMHRMTRMDKAEAEEHVAPVREALPPELQSRVQVHENLGAALSDPNTQMGPNTRRQAQAKLASGGQVAGLFDPETKTVHIFADGHSVGDRDGVLQTLRHEMAHFGNRNILGDDYGKVMQDIFDHIHNRESPLASQLRGKTDKVTAREWMKDYADQHGLDLTNPRHQQHVADEYAAHLAENPEENRSLWQHIVQAIRGLIHSSGLGKAFGMEWTDADIHDLVRRNNTELGLHDPTVDGRLADLGARFAMSKSDTDPSLPHSDPESIAAKFGRTMEEQAGAGPATLRSRGDFLRSVLQGAKDMVTRGDIKSMSSRLAFLHLDSLPDMMRTMRTPREFVRTTGLMEGRKGRIMDDANAIALKWSRWANGGIFRDPNGKMGFSVRKGQPDGGKALHDLMHSTTIAGVDPSREYKPAYEGELTPDQQQAERQRQAFYKKAKDVYENKLDQEGRDIYNQVRDFYQDRRADVLRGLEARIAETGADENTKKQLMTQLRQTFESGRVRGPYFPLARFGDHWAMAKDPETGEYAFSRFEDPIQRKRWLENAKAAGLDTDQGTKTSDKSLMERVDPDFVKKVMAATEGHKDLQDEIWQHYLKAMPEMSMRKHLIHRKNVLGYSEDALRAFAYNSFHSAHQIARLEYGNRLDSIADRMEEEAKGIASTQPDSSNAYWAPALANEFRKRLEWIKNPKAGSLSSGLTKLGFAWYIGASPATAIRISTQNAMLAEPYLGAKASKWGLGYNAGRAELWKAVRDWSATSLNPFGKSNLGDSLRGDERAAFDEARARGTFSSTSAQTLASGGADRPIGVGPLDAFNRVTSFMFNAMEHKNRMTTMLAAYRLARKGGLSHEEATEEAIDASNKAHFNYNNYNRPRVLQNDFMKVAGLFKQYPWQVTDRLARSFRDGVLRNSDLSPEERNEQLKAFAGYMGKMMLFASIKGVPILYHATMAAINSAFSTENKPFDAQAALREHLEQSVGKTASDAIMDGPMSALTGAALSNGASYSDLWYKQPQRDMSARDQAADLIGQMAGPVYGSIPEFGVGADIIKNGDTERGLEHMTPPAVNHLMKSWRLGHEGATNLRGEQVVSPEELGQGWSTDLVGLQAVRAKNLLLQALGFSPEVVARQYEKNTSAQNFKQEVTERQRFLNEQYDNAVLRGDNDGAIKWMQQMQQFHKENPGVPWSARGIENGIRSRAKAAATADHGVNMSPGLQQEYSQMTGAK